MAGQGGDVPMGRNPQGGFTLLEVLVAVAILSMSLTSLLGSQLNSMMATRYARSLTQAVFLSESVMLGTQRAFWEDSGWGTDTDVEYSGSLDYLDAPDFSYKCVVEFLELPEYNEMVEAKDAAEDATDGSSSADDQYMDTGEQAFGALGTVWPLVKNAIEQSIRKHSCTVFWKDGNVQESFEVTTFLVHPDRLTALPSAGGEVTESDDDSSDGPGQGQTGANGLPGGGGPGGLGGGFGGSLGKSGGGGF